MSYRLNLTHVDGRAHEWTVDQSDIVIDRHGHVLAFTVRFNDGTSTSFGLGEEGSFVRRLMATKVDEAGAAGAGAMMGRSYGAVGMALGAVGGWVAAEVLENVLLENADYYDDSGRKSFRGVIKLR